METPVKLPIDPPTSSATLNGDNNSPFTCTADPDATGTVKNTAGKSLPTLILPSEKDKISCGKVDKRVALTVAPKLKSRDESEPLFANKVAHVLGPHYYTHKDVNWLTSSKFYGFLRNALGSTSGLIFPYTPSITFDHTVNYETTDIVHSNISYNYYKNSAPPTISLTGKFTADNRDNALHMLSAIWFCVACSKCEFGENSIYPGLPPPIIYLSGYDHLIDNIPVVITHINYKYPDNVHYVNLVMDMSKNYNKNEAFCKVYDTFTTTGKLTDSLSNIANELESNPSLNILDKLDVPSIRTSKNGIDMSFWLPTELTLTLQLKVQPNLLKTRKQWSLDGYRSMLLMTYNSKNPPVTSTETILEEVEVPTGQTITTKEGMEVPSCTKGFKSKKVTTTLFDFIPSGWTW